MCTFGLQLSASRDIAVSDSWEFRYSRVIQARTTLGFIIAIIGLIFWLYGETFYLILIVAPFIGLNGDFALYSRGKPIIASIISFFRVAFPNLLLIIASIYLPEKAGLAYGVGFLLSFFIAGIWVSMKLNIPYYNGLSLYSLKEYYKSFRLGLASVAFSLVGVGILSFAKYFYNDSTIAISFIILKIYIIYKGARRLIIQSFYKDLINSKSALYIDKMGILFGGSVAIILIVFVEFFVKILFGETAGGYEASFAVIGSIVLLSSFTTSAGTRALLKKADRLYYVTYIISAVIAVFSVVIFSEFWDNPFVICLSIGIAELYISIVFTIKLSSKTELISKLKVLFIVLLIISVFSILNIYFILDIISTLILLGLYGTISLVYLHFHKKKI